MYNSEAISLNNSYNDYNLSPERELILLLMQFHNPDKERILELLQQKLDWSEILGHLVYNRMAGVAYHVLGKCKAKYNIETRFGLYMFYELQKLRTLANRKYITELSDELRKSSIKHAFLKGSVLANSIYPLGCRSSKDIDILVNSEDLTACSKILVACGFTQGFHDRINNEIKPANRREIIQHRMNYGEIVPFLKKVEDPGINIIEVDINFSLDWVAQGTQDAVSAFLNKTIKYSIDDNKDIQSLPKEYFLAHLCVHLYKEAYVLHWVNGQRDLSLYKFVDIYGVIEEPEKGIDWDMFINIVLEHNIHKECFLALEYTKTFFPVMTKNEMFMKALDRIRPDDEGYLNLVVDASNQDKKYLWKNDLITRFFDMKRSLTLEEVSS